MELVVIEVVNAKKVYGSITALEDISFKVEKGTIHGLIGLNGSGKTTLIKALVGVHKLDGGYVKILGEEVFENRDIKRKIGYVADRNRFFKSYTVNRIIRFYANIYPDFDIKKFDEYNSRMKLPKDRKISALSKGMQMKLSIMLNLARNPEVLILDEPTSGLDVITKKDIFKFIISAVEQSGVTVLISSHQLHELEKLCDDITMICQGKMDTQQTMNQIRENLKKIQVAFNSNDVVIEKDEAILKVTKIGSIYYILTNNIEETTKKLTELGATLIEELNMTVEEIFIDINENEEENV